MENKSPIRETYNTPHLEAKEKIGTAIKENLNYIYIVLMIIANCLLSLLRVEDGEGGINYPKSKLAWIMFIIQIFSTVVIGVMILNAFRRQGVRIGHKAIDEVYQRYLKAIARPDGKANPRSLKKYLRTQSTRDSLTKSLTFMVINVFVISVTINANLNSLLSLIVNIIFAVSFGIKAMLDAEDYVLTELVIWYQIKIKELESSKVGEHDRHDKRHTKLRLRLAESGRIQQAKEHGTRQPDSNDEQPNCNAVKASSVRISS